MIHCRHVESGPALDAIRTLFLEYARGLNFNLCFQNFETELRDLPGAYAHPNGRLILCDADNKPAGCIALRQLDASIGEIKRLFVRPDFRGQGIGLKLTEYIINEARVIGYTALRLDTIRGRMDNAIALYKSVGFKEIPAYYDNPIPDALYMELCLYHHSYYPDTAAISGPAATSFLRLGSTVRFNPSRDRAPRSGRSSFSANITSWR